MALYNPGDIPQTSQSVNIGQFGPSHDSLQDWRSVFQVANKMDNILEDVTEVQGEINTLKDQTTTLVIDANNAVSTANQINADTISNVEVKWQQINAAQQEVESDRAEVDSNTHIALDAANLSQQEATKSAASAKDSLQLKEEMEGIRNDVTHLTVSASSIDHGGVAKATFNSDTNHLHLDIPKIEQVGESAVFTVNGKSGNVTLSASDVGAIPDAGDIKFQNKISFPADDSNEFEIDAKVNAGTPELTLLAGGVARKGLVIDNDGNSAFGGRLFVNNLNSADKKEVFHEGNPPTAAQVGAFAKSETLAKTDIIANYRRKDDSYSRTEIDNKVNAKLSNNPQDGKLYGRKNNTWAEAASKAEVDSKATQEALNAALARITALESKPSYSGPVKVWTGSKNTVYWSEITGGKRAGRYTVQVNYDRTYMTTVVLYYDGTNQSSAIGLSNVTVTVSNNYINTAQQITSIWWEPLP